MTIELRDAERTRRVGDQPLQALFMVMDDGAVSRDRNGDIVAVNPAAEKILGLSAAELIGRSSADLARALKFVREDETPFLRELDPATLALQTGRAHCNVLMGVHRPDGSLVWTSVNAQPLPSDDGSGPAGVVTTFRDVTERKRAEEALSFVLQRGWMASHERFFDALVKYLGKTLGVDHVLISVPTDDPDIAETVAHYARGAVVPNRRYGLKGAPCEEILERKFCFYSKGTQLRFPDDALLAEMGAEGYFGLPLWDSAGQPIGLLAVLDSRPLRDEALVSHVLQFVATRAAAELERERSDRVLRQREREFRSLADNMPDNVVRYDRQARVRYMNPALSACVAPEFLPVLGEALTQAYPGNEGAASCERLVEQVIATGSPAEIEFEMPNPRGELRLHQVRLVAERDGSGAIIGALGIGRDITEHRASERQLREALEFTEGVINAIPDLLFELDRDGTYLNVWAHPPELLVAQKEALLGKTVFDVLAPDAAEVAVSAVREADEKGTSFGKVLRMDISEGERWCELSVSRKPGSDVPGRFIVLSRDITGRKRMEDDIRRRELEFRSLAEHMPDMVVRYDRQARVKYFNPALTTSLAPELMPVPGLSAAESMRGSKFLTSYHVAIERVIATGMPFEVEFQVPNPQGEMRDHQAHLVAERDGSGEVVGALAIGRDVTERNRMEQAVAVREQEFRSLAENSRDRIIRYDRDGRVRYLNSQLRDFFGVSATDIIGRRTREVWPDGCYAGIERACAHAVETGEATTVEFDMADATGALRSHQVVVAPERDAAGQVIGALGFGRDVTSLRETERTLRHFIENLPGMAYTFRISRDGRAGFPYVSPAIKELFGLEPEDVKNDMAPLHRLAHPEDRPRIDAAIAESAQTMTPCRVEYRVCRPGQPERWVSQRSVPEREAGGSIIWYGIMLDITERKLAEEYEHFRSRTLEWLAGGAPLPALLEGIVRGVEQLKPDMMCSILLLDREGKRLGEGVAPSLPEFYNAAVDGIEIGLGVGCCGTAAATGQRVITEDIATHPYWAPYKELVAKAGLGACWSEPIRASTGQVLGTFAVYHRQAHSPAAFDIALIEKSTRLASIAIERRRAEEALRASELEFRTLAENLPDFLVRYDREGRRTYLNRAMERVRGAPTELLGKTLRDTNPTRMLMPETYQRALERTLATGERSEFEMQVPMPGGNKLTGQCFMVAEREADGRISGAIAVTRDITERKRNEAELERHRHHLEKLVDERTLALLAAKEAAEAATRAKSHFLAAASHDLRQPLQAIRLFSEALAMSGLNKQQKEIADTLSRSARSLGELLNDLLDLSRLDAGTIEAHPAAIEATDLLDAISKEFEAVCQDRNLRLRLVRARRGLTLFSDENLLLTLLRNLVSNAVKYTRRGGVLVGVRRRGDRALIQVWDTGIGIPAEQKDSIFEEYFQIGNPERDRAKGVGLGLAIVRRLSELLDVGVRFRSREGKGSVFEASVPRAPQRDMPASPQWPEATPETAARSRLAGQRIVIIEDDEMAGEAIKLALEMEGAKVILFGRPEEALGSAEAKGADCYLSDYRLPGMNGLQLLDALQKKAASPIKAVLLTGNVWPDQIALLQASRWKVMLKPVALAELLSALGEAVRRA
jgi:PAS domain S-box-containing protein